MKHLHHSRRTLYSLTVLLSMTGVFDACNSTKGTDSQTNWLSPCEHESDCGAGLRCFCGTCTTTCASGCDSLGTGASCITVRASAASACAPALPAGGVCSFSCATDDGCAKHGSDLRCLGGACLAAPVGSTDAGGAPDSGPGAGGLGGASGAGGPGGASGAGGRPSSGGGASGTDGGDAGLAAVTAPLLISIEYLSSPQNMPGIGESNGIVRGFLPPRCERKVFGTCLVDNCLVRRDGNLYGLTGVSAGVVTIHGGTGADVVFTPDPFGVYPDSGHILGPARWHAGDSLQISATGGDVPAFSATLTFLTPLVLTSPDPGGAIPLPPTVVDRAKGLMVTWTPTDETVSVSALHQGPGGQTWDRIEGTCDFPGTAGTATLPPEFFKDFPPSGIGLKDWLFAGHSQVKTQQAGSHPVRLITSNGPGSSQDEGYLPITVQ